MQQLPHAGSCHSMSSEVKLHRDILWCFHVERLTRDLSWWTVHEQSQCLLCKVCPFVGSRAGAALA